LVLVVLVIRAQEQQAVQIQYLALLHLPVAVAVVTALIPSQQLSVVQVVAQVDRPLQVFQEQPERLIKVTAVELHLPTLVVELTVLVVLVVVLVLSVETLAVMVE
jgi:hypothetical protein